MELARENKKVVSLCLGYVINTINYSQYTNFDATIQYL